MKTSIVIGSGMKEPYKITKYTFAIAKEYGLRVEPSTRAGKKIKVIFKDGTSIHLGDIEKMDYATMLVECKAGKMKIDEAEKRRISFCQRFKKGIANKNSGAYWVSKLLWLV